MSTRLVHSTAIAALAIGMILLSIGCAQAPSTEGSAEGSASSVSAERNDAKPSLEKAREAAQIVVAMQKEPNRVKEILEAHGTNQVAFEELLFNIAQDPEMTEAYEAARTAASP